MVSTIRCYSTVSRIQHFLLFYVYTKDSKLIFFPEGEFYLCQNLSTDKANPQNMQINLNRRKNCWRSLDYQMYPAYQAIIFLQVNYELSIKEDVRRNARYSVIFRRTFSLVIL